jgi:hypothetical protein
MARKKMEAPPKLSPELETELRDKLEDLLDEHDDVSDKRRRLNRMLSGHMKVVAETIGRTRRQLKGIDLDQVEIPGTEKPEPARDPLVSEILRIAGGIVERKKDGEEPELLAYHGARESGLLVANVIGGQYRIERCEGTLEGWTAIWKPASGRQKLLAVQKPIEECKDQIRAHHLDRAGSDLLENGGE